MLKINTEKMYDIEYEETGESENTTWFFQELVSDGVEFQTKNDDEFIHLFDLVTEEDQKYDIDETEYLYDILNDNSGLYLSNEEWNRSKELIRKTENYYNIEFLYEVLS